MESHRLFVVLIDRPNFSPLLKGDIVIQRPGSPVYYNTLHSACLRDYAVSSIWAISSANVKEIVLTGLESLIYGI